MEKRIYELTIDPELERIAPPLKACELELLKEDLLENGCVSPLIVWGGVIVDGHNRYRICREYCIPFAVEQMDFEDKTDVKCWIARNQLGRRNLTPFQRCEMILPLEAALKIEAEKRRVAAISKSMRTGKKAVHAQNTRDVLADMAGVSHGTLDKAKAILGISDEETLRRLRVGEISISFAYSMLTGKTRSQSIPTVIAQNIDSASYMVKALIEELNVNDLDAETIISILTDIVETLERR